MLKFLYQVTVGIDLIFLPQNDVLGFLQSLSKVEHSSKSELDLLRCIIWHQPYASKIVKFYRYWVYIHKLSLGLEQKISISRYYSQNCACVGSLRFQHFSTATLLKSTRNLLKIHIADITVDVNVRLNIELELDDFKTLLGGVSDPTSCTLGWFTFFPYNRKISSALRQQTKLVFVVQHAQVYIFIQNYHL